MSDEIIVSVKQAYEITVRCPKCDKIHVGNVAPLRGRKHVITNQCGCGYFFQMSLDFRTQRRKSTCLQAELYYADGPADERAPGIIRDLSSGGAKIEIIDTTALEKGDKLMVDFANNPQKGEKEIIVRGIAQNKYINVEFCKKNNSDLH